MEFINEKDLSLIAHTLLAGDEISGSGGMFVYPRSVRKAENGVCFMLRSADTRWFVAAGNPLSSRFSGRHFSPDGLNVTVCGLTPETAETMTELFPFTVPTHHQGHDFTLGLGDRLGLATPGHLTAIKGQDIFPVLAQQSVRELTLTGRTFRSVIADAAFGVFQQGYTGGWGADGDHLKTDAEVRDALRSGCTMITLDCSEQIDNSVPDMTPSERDYAALNLPPAIRETYDAYVDDRQAQQLGFTVAKTDARDIALIYHKAVEHAAHIYHDIIAPSGKTVDFEMSIDETLSTTSPAAHFVVGRELLRLGVKVVSLAPRFCGEFQKGIDFIGDTAEFEKDFSLHARIADALGYKISVHSGSDKFRVFPLVGQYTRLRVHVKTAGTSWLEALRVIARVNPALYRRMQTRAVAVLPASRRLYHISGDPALLVPLERIKDEALDTYLDEENARQILHIAYGQLLTDRDEDGKYLFREEFFQTLLRHESNYSDALKNHIGRHITALKNL